MDPRSESFLPLVELDLVRVLRMAAQAPQPFVVVQGVRSPAQEALACASGHSETMRSRHFPRTSSGLAAAVDVAALIGGTASFAAGREEEVFGAIAAQVKAAAKVLSIPLQWGGDPVGAWTPGVASHFRDWGHFQLPWAEYP